MVNLLIEKYKKETTLNLNSALLKVYDILTGKGKLKMFLKKKFFLVKYLWNDAWKQRKRYSPIDEYGILQMDN